jgi:sulfane dehydrogenase subunit SoxC
MEDTLLSRRILLASVAGALGVHALHNAGLAQVPGQPRVPPVPPDPTKVPGTPLSELGQRLPFERPRRIPIGGARGISLAPLQDLRGIVTPADLHFERHHAGVPAIDPQRYKLLIHGMVEHPTVFDLGDLKRFSSVSHLYFLECSGTGA